MRSSSRARAFVALCDARFREFFRESEAVFWTFVFPVVLTVVLALAFRNRPVETHKVAVTRLGSRIRVGGTAELAGYSLALREPRRATLEHVANDLFPGGGDVARADFWCGLRPMTPDGTPIIGATPIANLYLATGHGTLGWTMAAGTGRVIADLISGRKPEIDLDGLTMARYRA